jgi:hypothetical protein
MIDKYYLSPLEVMKAGGAVKKYVGAPHIEYLSDVLTNVVYNPDYYDRACISLPPRSGKSSLITLSFPFWLILNNPYLNIIIVNNTQTLADNFGIRLRQMFLDNKDLLENFNISLSEKRHARATFMFEVNGELAGSIKLMGAMGTITGQDVDILICDDLLKGFTDCTPTMLEKMNNYVKEILLQRLEPHSKMIMLATRWHSEDPIGVLEKEQPERYKFIKIKALNDDGTCIWPERYKPEFFNERRNEIGDRMFEALYQQSPLDETGDFFDIDCINFEPDNYDPNTAHVISKCRSWDFAYTDEDPSKNSDYSAGAYLYLNYRNEIVLSDLKHGRFGDDLIKTVQSTAKHDGVNTPIMMETGTKGGASEFLYKEYRKYLKGYNTKQSLPIGSKVDRATPLKDLILDGLFRINIYNDNLREDILRQFKAFPYGAHDDIIDAIAYGVQYLLNSGGVNTVGVSGLSDRKRLFR